MKETQRTYQHSLFAILDPPPGSKISGLSTVEAMVKAGMVPVRESDHKFSSFLSHLNKSRREAAAANGRHLETWEVALQLCYN